MVFRTFILLLCNLIHTLSILETMTKNKHTADFNSVVAQLQQAPHRKRVALVCPADTHTQYVIERAMADATADFLLVSGGQTLPAIEAIAHNHPDRIVWIHAATPDEAARRAVTAVREGEADVLMKGTINTDNLLRAVLNKEWGLLQPGQVMSHVAVASIPSRNGMLVFSDAAVIPQPDVDQLDAIVRYTVATARRLGAACPKVALTHCTEKVSERFPVTLAYEELKRRAAAGAYGPVCLGGPMDVKTALDAESGSLKGITSPVVGQADVLVFPDIEAGNTFYKALSLFAHATTAGMLCGTTAPAVVASRADSGESKYYSLVMACVMS